MTRFSARLSAAPLSTAVISFTMLAACGSPANGTPDGGQACSPDLAAFETSARPHIERYCGSCHGETPNFGAPMSLLDGESLLAPRADGTRLVDRIAERIVDGTMPPLGMPRMPDADADAIVSWASCGALDAPEGTGLRSSAPPFLAPANPPAGLDTLEFLADEHVIGPDVRDEYRCFVFDADIAEERFVRRFEMVFGETRVLHHIVVLRDVERRTELGDFDCYDGSGMPAGSQYLYAWAPGQSALEFPEGGLRIAPGERFVVQIHYNNGAALPDVRDSSGVRLYLGPVEGPEYGMVAMGPTNFLIPARDRAVISSRCTFAEDTTIIAGMPHMHFLGESFSQSITRAAGGRETLIALDGWRFETQLFYSIPTTLHPGDAITTSCTFQNPGASDVPAGENTADEMCFDFMYATPPPASRYCDEGDEEHPTDVRYVPGECLPAGTATDDLPLVRGSWTQAAEPPALVQASVPDARWVMEGLQFYLTNPNTPIGAIDLEATYVLARGQVITSGGTLSYDVDADNVVLTDSGIRFGEPDSYSFRGAFSGGASPATLPLECPAGGTAELDWGIEGDVLTIGFVSESVPGSTLWPRYRFRRVP